VVLSAGALAVASGDGQRVGPGPVRAVVSHGDYRVEVRISPNAGGRRQNTFVVQTTQGGRPVSAAVSVRFTMPAMAMPSLSLRLRESAPGRSSGTGETLKMPGRWVVVLHVAPRAAPAFDVRLIDNVRL
jgi:hypothetical protein